MEKEYQHGFYWAKPRNTQEDWRKFSPRREYDYSVTVVQILPKEGPYQPLICNGRVYLVDDWEIGNEIERPSRERRPIKKEGE